MGCGCPRPPSAALPPQGYSPLFSSPSSPRCGARPSPAPAVLPLPRRSVPFWRPWVAAPGELGRRSGTGPAAVSGAARRGARRGAGERLPPALAWQRPGRHGGGCWSWVPPRVPGGWVPFGGLISALSSPASQPPRAGGSLPKAGAVHAPRQVSGCPGAPPPVPAGEQGVPAGGAPGTRPPSRPGRERPSLGSILPGWPNTGSPAPFHPTRTFM